MKHTSGFTLLELLIGLVLLGFIMVLLFGGFSLATRSWEAVESRALDAADEQAASAFVRRVLGGVQPLRMHHLPGQPLAFSGQSDRLILVAPLTEQTGLRTIELAVVRQAGPAASYELVLRDGPPPYGFANLLDVLAEAKPRTLIDDLAEVHFEFFGTTGPAEGSRWQAVWQSAENLPALIRMRLVRRGEAEAVDLIAATMIAADRSARVRITVGGAQ